LNKGIVESHQSCQDISVANEFDIELNSNFTFVGFPISSPDSVFLKKILVHEFGHAILARHSVNRSIMYPDLFFENISTLTADDHLCGEHSFVLGHKGATCEPIGSLFNLNIGEFDCQINPNSIGSKIKYTLNFNVYPNPAQDYFTISTEDPEEISEDQIIRIIDINGFIMFTSDNVEQKIDVSNLPFGMYYIQILRNGHVLGTEKLIHHD